MPGRLPEGARAPADFDPQALAEEEVSAAGDPGRNFLGCCDRNTGHQFASLVNVATDVDGAPVILTSRLSTHTANLEADGRASVLLAETGKGDPLAHPRLTVLGEFARTERESADEARVRRRSSRAIPSPSFTRASATFRSGAWLSPPRISMAVSRGLPIWPPPTC